MGVHPDSSIIINVVVSKRHFRVTITGFVEKDMHGDIVIEEGNAWL